MKTKKLLQKTIFIYLSYFFLSLFIVSPVFYYIANHLYIENTDEFLYHKKEFFSKHILPDFHQNDIPKWNTYHHYDVQIIDFIPLQKDSFFTITINDEIENEPEPYRFFYSPVSIDGKKYIYSDKISILESEDLMVGIALLFILLFCIVFIGIIFITHRITNQLWNPFYTILNELEKFEVDKNIIPALPHSDVEEFYRLKKSAQNLIEKNIHIYKNQKEFVENAAHELQTPVAVIKAKLDQLIQNSDISTQQANLLSDINEQISKLSRLNKNLLLLTKIEKHLYTSIENFTLNGIIEKQLSFFSEQASLKNIQINYTSQQIVKLNANKDLTEIIISNLLQNAVRHNIHGGKIEIELYANFLVVSNTGKNESIPKEKIFQRFSKINSNSEGTGLGLFIIKKSAEINNWRVEYYFKNNLHHFKISF